MAWIKVTKESDGEGALADSYRRVGATRGRVSNILRIHSINPRAMTAHLHLYQELLFGASDLTRAERELIAVAVSRANGCHY